MARAPFRLIQFPHASRRKARSTVSNLARRVMQLEAADPDFAATIDRLTDRGLARSGDLAAQARVRSRDIEHAQRSLRN